MVFSNHEIELLNQTVGTRISKGLYHTYENNPDIWVYFPYGGYRIRCIHEEHWDRSITRRFYIKEDPHSIWEHFATCFCDVQDSPLDWGIRIANKFNACV